MVRRAAVVLCLDSETAGVGGGGGGGAGGGTDEGGPGTEGDR